VNVIVADLKFTDAFATYGAKLRNVQWSVCALAPNGDLVVSLWEHHLKPSDGEVLACRDSFARWSGLGNAEFRERIAEAKATGRPVKVVIAHSPDPAAIQRGVDASTIRKTFSVRPDWLGRVTEINGDDYVIEFRSDSSPA
jgi:hypothetical protein